MKPQRIWIFGGTGSGKTTFAREFSEKTNIPFYTTDDMVYGENSNFREKLSEEERNSKLATIASKEKWIIEGVHGKDWLEPSFKRADFVIIIKTNTLVRLMRVLRREIKDRNNMKLILKLIYYVLIYNFRNFKRHKNLIKKYNKNFIQLNNQSEMDDFLENYGA